MYGGCLDFPRPPQQKLPRRNTMNISIRTYKLLCFAFYVLMGVAYFFSPRLLTLILDSMRISHTGEWNFIYTLSVIVIGSCGFFVSLAFTQGLTCKRGVYFKISLWVCAFVFLYICALMLYSIYITRQPVLEELRAVLAIAAIQGILQTLVFMIATNKLYSLRYK